LVRRVKRAGHFGLPTFEKGNSMLNLIYHVVSASGALGYGNPRELLRLAFGGDGSMLSIIRTSRHRRDLLGSQQQAAIEHMNIPINPTALAEASSF
jgi:hypothetical protein